MMQGILGSDKIAINDTLVQIFRLHTWREDSTEKHSQHHIPNGIEELKNHFDSVNFIQKIRPVTAGKSKLRTGNPVSAKLITIGSACHAKIESEKSTPKMKYTYNDIFFGQFCFQKPKDQVN